MKNLRVMAYCLIACFLFCGFQQGSAPKPASDNGQAQRHQRADSSETKEAPAATAQADPVRGADKSQNQEVRVVSAPEITTKPVKDRLDLIIVVCTVILTIVGVVGTIVAIWTLRAIKRQAEIMEEHRTSLEQLAKAAADNAGAASKNAEFSKLNASATEKSAEAARASANAAEKSISVVIEKERARLFIEVDDLKLPQLQPDFWLLDVPYKLFIYGATLAFVEDSNATVFVSQSKDPPTKNGYQRVVNRPVITPTSDAISLNATSFGPSRGEKPVLEQVWQRQQFIHFFGFISYRDLWGNPHRTTFRFRWDITDIKNFDGTPFAVWHKIGPPEDNSET